MRVENLIAIICDIRLHIGFESVTSCENGITAHLKQICNVECRSNDRHKYQPRVRLRVSTRNDIFNVESISVEAFMTNTAGPPSKRHISTEDVCCAEQLEVDASGLAP